MERQVYVDRRFPEAPQKLRRPAGQVEASGLLGGMGQFFQERLKPGSS